MLIHLSGAYSGIKVLFTGVLGRDWDLNQLPRSRREKTLPAVLSVEQAQSLVNAPENLKHRTILQLIYATGLRLSEAVSLELNDIDSSRMVLIVHRGKGNKDRYVPLSATLLGALRHYWRCYRPKRYLFENANTGAHLSARTVQVVFQRAKEKLGLKGKISVHTLRHCYATHLLEHGVNVASLKVFLGHTNLSTTNRYLHISATHGDVPDLLPGGSRHRGGRTGGRRRCRTQGLSGLRSAGFAILPVLCRLGAGRAGGKPRAAKADYFRIYP